MKNCPICNNSLIFTEAKTYGFSWTNPSVNCSNPRCGFSYTEKISNHRLETSVGMSGFKIEHDMKNSANNHLCELFDVTVKEEIIKTRKIYS